VGLDKNEYNALTLNIQSLAKTLIQIVLVLTGFAVAGAIIGHVVSYLIAGVVGIVLVFFLLRREKGVSSGVGFADNTRLLLNYGSPLYLSTVLVGVVPLFQSIVLAFFVSDAAIGNFKAATNFALLMAILSIPIQTVMLPAFSKLKNGTSSRISNFFMLANKYTALIVVPVTVLIVAFSDPIVHIVYGSTYDLAPQFLWTYCLVYLLVGVGYLTLTSFYNGIGETKVTMRISLITFGVLVALSPLLTSVYGVQGLIVAYLIANGSGQVYSSIYARRKYQVKFDTLSLLKIYAVAILSGIAPVLILNYSGLSNVLGVAVGAVLYLFTYLTLMPILKVVSSSELKQASHAVQNIPILTKIAKLIISYQQRLFQLMA
jgi:O-antigen/teichoic acid export membrane protein